jgi:DNA-binding transcriptional regulator WhiA
MYASKMNLYELIGLIIGDGSILFNYPDKRGFLHYRLELTGDVNQDKEYYKKISKQIFKLSKQEPKIITRNIKCHGKFNGYGLKLYIYNKKFVEYLVNNLGLDYGNKTYTVKIPKKFTKWRYSKHIIRGIFESDGCLYFSKSTTRIYPYYPRVEIKTMSKNLAYQIYNILKKRDYNVQMLSPKNKCYKVYLSGTKMLNKWIKEIGFSNEYTISRYQLWKKLGYHIPNITFEQRKKLLKTLI